MQNQYLEDWLKVVSEPSEALKGNLGTAIWIDGIRKLEDLEITSFFKCPITLSKSEKYAFSLLNMAAAECRSGEGFLVSGHANLMLHSPLYRTINNKQATQGNSYVFESDEIGAFRPWTNTISLGTKFYSIFAGKTRIPFYTFNHENTHLKVFKGVYSNLGMSDEEMRDLFILSEWFCISMDLILAYDLIKASQPACFRELCRVPFEQKGQNIFTRFCNSIQQVNSFANEFRKTFLRVERNLPVFDLISEETLHFHREYAENTLLVEARKIPAAMGNKEASGFLKKLRTLSLTDLISELTGVQYV